jgi:UDP-N-acetylmuramoylalanine--D-glutamate ligase
MKRLRDKNVWVLGLGDTGLSAVRWLVRQGARVQVADTRAAPPNAARLASEYPGVALAAGPFDAAKLCAADLVVASPGVALAEPAVQAALLRGVPVVGDVELFAQELAGRARVLAITGSNGKSTVTAMTEALCLAAGLNALAAGNIGLPVLDALQAAEEKGLPDVFVLELSSFQLETTASLEADAATVLNVSEDHLDRYPGLDAYAAAKARIFHGGGIQVLNRDDARTLAMARPGHAIVTFGLDAPAEGHYGLVRAGADDWLAFGEERLLPVRELPLAGRHNAANALAALALCRALGLPFDALLAGLRAFRGLPHRVEKVGEVQGVTFYDDSKGTNVGATEAALKGMDCPVVLIAGGDGKGQDFSPLAAAVAGRARAVVLIGRDAPRIHAAIGNAAPVLACRTLEEAVQRAFQAARPGDAVLLSPACASWDMFRDYRHRAEVFVAAVRELEARHG